MNLDAESLRNQIPQYLSTEDQNVLVQELKAIASGSGANYFLSDYNSDFSDEMLQGDGWCGFQLFSYDTGERRTVRGLVLSNSCDIDPSNKRYMPTKVTFAPLVRLSVFAEIMSKAGVEPSTIKSRVDAIKSQKISNIFYLPSGGPLKEDHIVRLDEAQSMPFALHSVSKDREKLFTLSNTGFYMLVLKLSVHFCRLQEKINRTTRKPPSLDAM